MLQGKLLNIVANSGIYIALECTDESKKLLSEYVKEYIDPTSTYDKFHVTLIYSKKPFKGNIKFNLPHDRIVSKADKFITFDNDAKDEHIIALKLKCAVCEKMHKKLMKHYDFIYDYDEYIPHITLSYEGTKADLKKLKVPDFLIKFDNITVEPLDEEWAESN